jgi:hypothetical protein
LQKNARVERKGANELSRLLIDEHPLQVLPSLAEAIGLNEAIMLQQIHYWLKDSKKIHDGKPWTYNSATKWQEQFPFWSESTIRRTINSLRKLELIEVTSKYNKLPMDKTFWYTIRYEVLNRLTRPSSQNDHMVKSKCIDGDVNMTTPIPETFTKTTTETKNNNNNVQSSSDDLNERFESIYKQYPKKQGKKRAFAAYKKAIKAGVTDDTITNGIKRYCFMLEVNRTAAQYIKQAGTWFFNEGWNDEYATDGRFRSNQSANQESATNGGGHVARLARLAAEGKLRQDDSARASDTDYLEW